MIERIRPCKVVCRARPARPIRRAVVAAAILLGCGSLSMLHSAQASRRVPPVSSVSHEEAHEAVPGSITLAEMIEIQRSKRRNAALLRETKSAAIEGWEAQFGAFASPDTAAQLARSLIAGPLGRQAAIEVAAQDGLHRVRAPATDQSEAAAICATAQAQGSACFIRKR